MTTRASSRPPRVLLAGVFGPFGVDDDYGRKENVIELFHNQVTRLQGLSSLRFHHRSFGLYFIAENIDADVTVLDFPSRAAFIRELRRGYDIVGISFIAPNFSKAREMARLTRLHAPRATIVLGGHGTAIEGIEQSIDCDHVVRGEGIGWMRRFLGEDPDRPLVHPVLPANEHRAVFGIPIHGSSAGLLVPGVGCNGGCNFCSTTHFFGGYSRFLATGREIFAQACRVADALGDDTFFVMDENFLADGERARELLAEMETHQRWFTFHVFSSADTVVSFGIENLVRLGVHLLWIGAESKTGKLYPKLAGIDLKRLVADLRAHGISVLASAMLCMEHHTPENLQEDIDHVVGLEADFVQFMLYTGLPQTALYRDLKSRGRLRSDLPIEEWHGQKHLNYEHAAFPDGDSERRLLAAFRQDHEVNSSSIYRMIETALRGFRTLSAMRGRDRGLDARLHQIESRVRRYVDLLPVIARHAVNDLERARARALDREISTIFGPTPVIGRLARLAAQALAERWNWRVRLLGDVIQPRTIRTRYPAGRLVPHPTPRKNPPGNT
jgi:radical SAM superfamily enzyme YgiQ (UPF0313 family)